MAIYSHVRDKALAVLPSGQQTAGWIRSRKAWMVEQIRRIRWIGRPLAYTVEKPGRSITALVFVLAFFIHYLPDVVQTETIPNACAISSGQNTTNYTAKFVVPDQGGRVIEVQNMRQISDFHFWPGWMQDIIARDSNHNAPINAGNIPGVMICHTIRTSGWGLGDAHVAPNITQYDPTFPAFSYNLAGFALVMLVWLVPLVLLPKFAYQAMKHLKAEIGGRTINVRLWFWVALGVGGVFEYIDILYTRFIH